MNNVERLRTPNDETADLIEEILWWHSVTGNDVEIEDLWSKTRYANVVHVRADIMTRIRDKKGWSLPRIAKFFGKDHTTVMHHCNRKEVANRQPAFTSGSHHSGLPKVNPEAKIVVHILMKRRAQRTVVRYAAE